MPFPHRKLLFLRLLIHVPKINYLAADIRINRDSAIPGDFFLYVLFVENWTFDLNAFTSVSLIDPVNNI